MLQAEETIFYAIESAIKVYRRYGQAQIKESKMTIDQIMIINKIVANPDISQKELSKLVFKDMASTSRIIDSLVKNNYIKREINPNNRRRNKLEILPSAKKKLKSINKTITNNRTKALAGISEKELAACKATLEKIKHNLESV